MAGTENAPMARPTSGGWKAAVLNWVPTLLFNVVLPTATYSVLSGQGHGEVTSLLVSGVWPLLETVGTLTWQRKVDEFSIFTLIFLALSVVAALGFNSPRLLLVKESAVTGLFGVVLLASLLAPRPLMFYFGRKFATNGTPESIAWWNGLWQYAGFRSTQMIITAVWGVAMVTESLLHIWLTYQLSVASAVVVFNILPFVVTGLLIFWTVIFGKRRSARAAAAGHAAAVDPSSARA